MKELGFFKSYYDYTFYLNNNNIYMTVYVNNIKIVRPNLKLINYLKSDRILYFKIIDLSPISHYS